MGVYWNWVKFSWGTTVTAAFATLFFLTRFLCHVLARFRPAINQVLTAAQSGGQISSGQHTTVTNWLDAAEAVCAILIIIEL